MFIDKNKKSWKLFSGLFLSVVGSFILIKEYWRNEADHALVMQATGIILIGIGLITGKHF
jgi:hypothetical protein